MNHKKLRNCLVISGALNILLVASVLLLIADRKNPTTENAETFAQSSSLEPAHLIADLETTPPPRPAPATENPDQFIDPSEIEAATKEQRQRIMSNLTDNLTTPGMNRAIWDQQRIVLSEKYSALIKQLGLNEEEATYFLDLLTARQMLYVNVGMKQMTGALTAEELQALWQQALAGVEPINQEIDSFLNSSSDSELMEYYDRTEVERVATTTFAKECERNGMSLPEGSEEQLISIIMSEQEKTDLATQFNGDYSQLTEADIVRHQEEMNALTPIIAERASSILKPEQLSIWETTYMEYVKNQANWLRMVRQMTQAAE
jgi:hypothetical protein